MPPDARRLAGRVAVVTGAARGIGRAVARAYAAEGAVVVATDVVADELEAVAAEIAGAGGTTVAIPADIAKPEEVTRLFRAVEQDHGRVDVLANIAGAIVLKPIEETTLDDWNRIINVNLRGTFLCAKAAVPIMKRQRRGSIINTSSNAGVRGMPNETAYCASKHGVEGLSRALAKELEPFNIAVSTITPGTLIHTAMSEITYDADKRREWRDPAVLTPAYVHLALQDASGLNDRYVRAWDLCVALELGTPF